MARRIFSMGCRQTTQMGREPCKTLSAHSTHMAMCPHGTSRALRGSSRHTAHGSVSSGARGWAGGAGAATSVLLLHSPPPEGVMRASGEPGEPNFLRSARLGSDVMGSGQRRR